MIFTLAMAMMMGTGAIISAHTTAYANSTTQEVFYMDVPMLQKTATLGSKEIAFNGKEVTTIPTYTVEGTTYVPLRYITQNLGLGIDYKYSDVQRDIYIYTDHDMNVKYPMIYNDMREAYMKTVELPTFSVYSTIVNVERHNFSINKIGNRSVDAFKVGGNLFVNLDDILETSKVLYERIEFAGFALDHITASTNEVTGVMNLNVERVDFSTEVPTSTIVTAPTVTAPLVTAPTITAPIIDEISIVSKVAKNKVHETAPTVGHIYANILVDSSKPYYYNNDSTSPNNAIESNFAEAYKNNNWLSVLGQCTWYAHGRFKEVTGLDVEKYYSAFTSGVKQDGLKVVTDTSKIQAPAVAVFDKHVVFIEYVTYDANGNPSEIYYSEANHNNSLTGQPYRYGVDGAVKKLSLSAFVSKNSGFKGIIIPESHS